MSYSTRIFDDNAGIARFLGEKLAILSHSKDKVFLALSGGNTPKAIFELWANEYANKIEWKHLFLFWGDERCVAPNDPESNYGMTNLSLLCHVGIPKNQIFRIQGELTPAVAATIYQQNLVQKLPTQNGIPVFDIVLLGLGDDGHTLSIFPNQSQLWDSANICEVATHPVTGQKRVTFTGSVIAAAHEVLFLVTGTGKKQVVDEILNRSGNYRHYPAARVDNPNTMWLLDKKAAEFLETK